MSRLSAYLALAASVALASLYSTPSSGFSYVMMSDEAMLAQAEGVAKVTVIEIIPSKDSDRQTLYRVSVDDVLSGPDLGRQRLLSLPGTFDSPGAIWVVPGVPKLAQGSTYLVFHQTRADGTLLANQLTLGLFGLVPTDDGGVYERYLDEHGEAKRSPSSARLHRLRDAKGFEHWIRAAAKGETAKTDYFVDKPDANGLKFRFSNFNFPTPGPGRWFQFDSGQTLNWTARPGGQTGTTFDEFAAVATALNAWNNDPGSRITMAYSGTAPSTPTCNTSLDPGCFSGHVIWNDAESTIPGTFDCGSGGVLATGGSLAFSNGQSFAGQTWYPRARAVVTLQDNAACFFNQFGGANGAEVLAHEIGHTIAFGHSCGDGSSPSCGSDAALNAALMRAQAHGGGRGAVLGQDDRDGLFIAYPSPNPPMADLSLQIGVNRTIVAPGQGLTYTITVQNTGPAQATSLSLSTTLPSGLSFNSASGSGWSCTAGTANCTRASLNSGSSAAVSVMLTVPSNYAGASPITLQSSINSAVPDPQTGNNTAQAQTPVDFISPFRIFGGPLQGGFEP